MSKTEIDYLFQAIAPSTERSPIALRTGADSTGFNNHLSQASASVFDVVRAPSRSDSTSKLSRNDDRQSRTRYESNPSESNRGTSSDQPSSTRDRSENTSSPSSGTSQPYEPTNESSYASSEITEQDRDQDEIDQETGEIGAAVQAAGAATSSSTTETCEEDTAKQATDEAIANEVADLNAAQSAKDEKAASKKTADTISTENGLKNAATTDESASKGDADVSGESESTSDGNDSASKVANRSGADDLNAEKANAAAEGDKRAAANALAAGTDGTTANGEKLTTSVPAQSTTNAAAASASTDTAEQGSSDRETDNDAERSGNVESTNETPAVSAKADAAPIVADVVADIADATSNSEAAKDLSDNAAKPVAAKSETAIGPLGRAMRAVSDIARADQATNADATPQVDPARFVSRVTKAFQTAHERGGTLQLRLSPPELGAMRIQLNVKDGVMSASLETDNAHARRVLLDHLPALRDRLAEQNIRIERFDVDVKQESTGSQANPQGSNQNPYQPQPDQSEPRRPAASQTRVSEALPAELPAVASRISSTGINLVV